MSEVASRDWWRRTAPGAAASAPAGAEAERSSAVPFWALMAFTYVMLLAPQNSYPVLAPLRLALLAAVVAMAAHVYDRMTRQQPITVLAPEVRITGALVAWGVATVPLSTWPGGSVSLITDLYVKSIAIFLLLANTVNTLGRLRKMMWALTLMTIPLAFTGVQNFLSGSFVRTGDGVGKIVGYEAGLTKNPNDLAMMLNLLLPIGLGLLLGARSLPARLAVAAVVGLDAIGIVVTFSRAGFLALGATTIGLFATMCRRPERGWAWATVVVFVAALPLLPANYVSFLGTITDTEADPTGSAQHRREQQLAALRYIATHPIVGAGIGMSIQAMNEEMGPAWVAVHNAYLQAGTDLGLPGLVLIVLLVVQSIRSAGRVARRFAAHPDGREMFYLAKGIQLSLCSFAVSAFFAPVAYHFQLYYVAGLAVAVTLVGRAETTGATSDVRPPAVARAV